MLKILLSVTTLFFIALLLFYFAKIRFNYLIFFLRTIKERLYLSVPIGSFLIVSINILIYLFVQNGYWHVDNPLWIPFTTSGISNPIGTILGSWTHISPSHLFSNVFGTLIYAPVAEIIFDTNKTEICFTEFFKKKFSFVAEFYERIGSKPILRSLILFPFLWFIIGFFVSVSSPLGLGFSGVYFAILGFILILEPLAAIYLYLFQIIIENALIAIFNPIEVTQSYIGVTKPVWVNLGVWAHVTGFLLGILAGIALFLVRKDDRLRKPEPYLVTFSILIIGLTKGLDWLFKYQMESKFVLYNAAGLIFLILIALLSSEFWNKYGVDVKEETNINRLVDKNNYLNKIHDKIKSIIFDYRSYVILLVFIVLFMSSFMISAKSLGEGNITANQTVNEMNYEIWYEEDVGLLVNNQEKNIYAIIVSDEELSQKSDYRFYIGDLWIEKEVAVSYSRFSLVNGDSLKNIWINQSDGWVNLFSTNPRNTGLRVYEMNIWINYTEKGFLEILGKTGNSTRFKTELKFDHNKTELINGKKITYKFDDNKLILETEQFRTIVGKTVNLPPFSSPK